MKNRFLMRLLFGLAAVSSLALNFACAPQSGRSDAAAPTGQPVAQGTVSGGGGNGCDGAAFETYAKKISSLVEYRLFIRPLLRRMTEEGSDPFVTYLLWAAEEKAWYFIPCELQKISTTQIGLSVDSDQLARHGEQGVYIHSIENSSQRDPKLPPLKTYAQKKTKEKAVLLLHEMIMGARLLMKKTAKEQCTSLAKKDAQICDDSVLAIAETKPMSAEEAMVMDAKDHEAIRAMTAYLAEKGADVSAEKVQAQRDRLGFNFPWSRAASTLQTADVMNAFQRSKMLGDRFAVSKESRVHFDGESATCAIAHSPPNQKHSSPWITVNFVSVHPHSLPQAELEKFHKRHKSTQHITICADVADRIHENLVLNPASGFFESRKCEGEKYNVGWSDFMLQLNLADPRVQMRGVLRGTVAFDELRIETGVDSKYPDIRLGPQRLEAAVIKVLLTRENSPRIESIRVEPKQMLKSATKSSAVSDAQVEMLDIPGVSALECVRQTAP